MSNLAFDTHKFVRDLTKAKMPEEQAEVLAQHYANLLNDRLATKDDIQALRKDMIHLEERSDIKLVNLEERIDAKLGSLEERIDAKLSSLEERIDIKLGNLEERMDAKIDHLEERLNDRILYTALKSQMAGVLIICTVMGLMFNYF
jgi:chromosome segregation ATPase